MSGSGSSGSRLADLANIGAARRFEERDDAAAVAFIARDAERSHTKASRLVGIRASQQQQLRALGVAMCTAQVESCCAARVGAIDVVERGKHISHDRSRTGSGGFSQSVSSTLPCRPADGIVPRQLVHGSGRYEWRARSGRGGRPRWGLRRTAPRRRVGHRPTKVRRRDMSRWQRTGVATTHRIISQKQGAKKQHKIKPTC